MKITIFGNGAIGNLLALKSDDNHIDYNIVTRDGLPLTLHCTNIDGEKKQLSPAVGRADIIEKSDLVILPLKAYQIITAAEELAKYLTNTQVVVLLHNGMGTINKVKSLLPDIPLVAATTSLGAFKPSKTSLSVTGNGFTQAGWVSSAAFLQKQSTEQLLSELLTPLEWHTDVSHILWQKLAINAAINPLTALYDVKNGALLTTKYSEQIARVCNEVSQVMNALGYPTTAETLISRVRQIAESTANNYSSMNRDFKYHRKTEIEYINGYVVKQARKLGIEVPFNRSLQERIARN
jgi:2-dehydropantoate 2-reductase